MKSSSTLSNMLLIRNIKLLSLLFFLFFTLVQCTTQKENKVEEVVIQELELVELIKEWSNSFLSKIDSSYTENINIGLKNGSEQWNLVFSDKNYQLNRGKNSNAVITFTASLATFNKIYRGEINAMTAMSQAIENESIPLEYDFSEKIGFDDSSLNRFFFIAQRFFNKDANDKVALEESASRFVHCGHAIPIFYQKHSNLGVRSAWYQINQGEQVNEIGDTNPYPQYIIITQGEGKAKFGNDTIPVIKDRAYFVPVDSDHVIWNPNEEPIKLIWIAWGKGA